MPRTLRAERSFRCEASSSPQLCAAYRHLVNTKRRRDDARIVDEIASDGIDSHKHVTHFRGDGKFLNRIGNFTVFNVEASGSPRIASASIFVGKSDDIEHKNAPFR